MGDLWLQTLPLLVVAITGVIIAAVLGYYSNHRLKKLTQSWEERRHLIASGEKFCDDLMETTLLYWHMSHGTAKTVDLEILMGRISASIVLIIRFVNENYDNDINTKNALKEAIANITGGDFSKLNRPPDQHRAVMSVNSIIDLRFAFSGAKPAFSCS